MLDGVAEARKRLKDSSEHVNAKRELVDTVYPLMTDGMIALVQRIEDLEDALQDLVSKTASIVQPDLAAQLDETLSLALGLCDMVVKAGAPMPVQEKAAELQASVIATAKAVAEVAISDEEVEAEVVEGGGVEPAKEATASDLQNDLDEAALGEAAQAKE